MRRAVILLVVVSCFGFLFGLRELALTRQLLTFSREMEELYRILQRRGGNVEAQQLLADLLSRDSLSEEARAYLKETRARLPAEPENAVQSLLRASAVIARDGALLQSRSSMLIILAFLGIAVAGGLLWASSARGIASIGSGATQDLLSAAVSSTGHGVLLCDIKGRAKWVNDAWCTLTGAARGDIVDRPLGDVAAHLGLDAGELEEGLQATDPFEIEAKVQKGDEQLWAGLHLSPIRQGNRVTHFALTLRNITEEKEQGAENLLLARTLQSSDVGFLILDSSRKVVWANESWCSLTNLDRPYILGQSFQLICRALDFDSRQIKSGADGTESVVVESSTTIEGAPRAYRWRVSPVRIAEGEVAYAVSLWRTDDEEDPEEL